VLGASEARLGLTNLGVVTCGGNLIVARGLKRNMGSEANPTENST